MCCPLWGITKRGIFFIFDLCNLINKLQIIYKYTFFLISFQLKSDFFLHFFKEKPVVVFRDKKVFNNSLYWLIFLPCPSFFVEVAVVDGFGKVLCLYVGAVVEVSNGARHFQYSVVSACRKIHARHSGF